MHNLQPCARRAHKHPIIDIYLPIVGRIYPIPEYICQLLAEYIQYKNISPNCWQNIYSIRIYPQLLAEYIQYQNISPIFGRIYLIPEYIQYQYTYIFNYSCIPNCWQYISNTNIWNTEAWFAGAKFTIKKTEPQFATNKFSGAQFAAKGPNLPGPDLPGPNLPGPDLPGPDLPGPNLPGSNLPGPNLPGPNLPRTPLPHYDRIIITNRAMSDLALDFSGELIYG